MNMRLQRFSTLLFSLAVTFAACSAKPSEKYFIDRAIERDTVAVRSALKDGINPNLKVGEKTALIFMVINDRTDIVRILLEHGADVNAKDEVGWTALIWAADKGQVDAVRVLLDRGADVNAKNEVGWTALIVAARNGHADIVRALLNKRADLNAKDSLGMTALQYGINANHDDVVQLLKKAGVGEQLIMDNAGDSSGG